MVFVIALCAFDDEGTLRIEGKKLRTLSGTENASIHFQAMLLSIYQFEQMRSMNLR